MPINANVFGLFIMRALKPAVCIILGDVHKLFG